MAPTYSTLARRVTAFACLAGCAADFDDGGLSSAIGASTVDMAEYMLPACGAATRAWRFDGQEFRTIPMGEARGMAHYVFVKSADGDGYEDWWIDNDWLRIRFDRTWAYCVTAAGGLCADGDGQTHLWCDVQCGRDNTPATCQRRWDGDPRSPYNGLRPRSRWAATQYQSPGRPDLAAPFIKRRLALPIGGSTRFAADMEIVAVDRDTCAPCATNFDTAPGSTVRRSVLAQRLRSWRGFFDVVQLTVTAGPGTGEASFYARGLGLIGFGVGASVTVATGLVERDTRPRGGCAPYVPASACTLGGSNCAYWPPTGQHLCGRLRQYWESNGGLPVFGYPVTAAQPAVGEDGRAYPTQWFERARLEYHGENAPPYDVLLGRLGDQRFRAMHGGADFWSTPRDAGARAGCRWFPETRINVCDVADGALRTGFLAYWRGHGVEFDGRAGASEAESLALFGLPLTPVMTERLSDGRDHKVQWFERARFELHTDANGASRVLLGLLGNEMLGR